jgi:hypothetical protein
MTVAFSMFALQLLPFFFGSGWPVSKSVLFLLFFFSSHLMTDTVGYAPVIKLPRSKSSSSNFPTRRDKSDHLVSDTLYFEGLSRTDQITEDDLMDLMHDCQPLE